jgi:hypothetical protein
VLLPALLPSDQSSSHEFPFQFGYFPAPPPLPQISRTKLWPSIGKSPSHLWKTWLKSQWKLDCFLQHISKILENYT